MVNRFALTAHSKDWEIQVASYVSEFAYSPLPLHIFLAMPVFLHVCHIF